MAVAKVMELVKQLRGSLFGRPAEPEDNQKMLQELASTLDKSERHGAPEDKPEGTRYIQVSDTMARYLAKTLRKAAFSIKTAALDPEATPVVPVDEEISYESQGSVTLTPIQLRARPDQTSEDKWVVILLAKSGAPYAGNHSHPALHPDYHYTKEIDLNGNHTYSWVVSITGRVAV